MTFGTIENCRDFYIFNPSALVSTDFRFPGLPYDCSTHFVFSSVGAGFDVVGGGLVVVQAVKEKTAPKVIFTIKRSIFRFIRLDLNKISRNKVTPRYASDNLNVL